MLDSDTHEYAISIYSKLNTYSIIIFLKKKKNFLSIGGSKLITLKSLPGLNPVCTVCYLGDQMHTEKYSSSDVGNGHHGIREAQHAYSNSTSGVAARWKLGATLGAAK